MSLGMKTLSYLDFNSPFTPKNQVKFQYAATIAARLLACRSQEETRETLTRDIPGFFALLYIADIIEKSVGYILDKCCPGAKDGAKLIKGSEPVKSFWQMVNPLNKHRVRSFEDIKALNGIISPENYNALMRNKSVVFLVGMATSICALGIFIPWFNVKITREKVLGEKNCSSPLPKINMNVDPDFKPGINQHRFTNSFSKNA